MSSHCFAPKCNTNYASARKRNKLLGVKNPSVFSAPKDPVLFKRWQIAIPRKDKIFSQNDRLCELHFEEECIMRNFDIPKLFDGNVFVLERAKPILKPGSIPTKFRNLPEYPPKQPPKRRKKSSKTQKRKAPPADVCLPQVDEEMFHHEDLDENLERASQCAELIKNLGHVQKPDPREIFHHDGLDENEEQASQYEELVKNLGNVQKPDPQWTVSHTADFVICAQWDSDCSCERRVVIFKDFSSKIFLRNVQISIENASVDNAESLSQLLQKVHMLIICQGVAARKLENCIGYVNEDNLLSQCSVCRAFRSKLLRTREENELGIWPIGN